MYSLVVREDASAAPSAAASGAPSPSATPKAARAARGAADAAADANASDAGDQLGFSAGNPRVEHITGAVHLYRHLAEAEGDGGGAAGAERDGGGGAAPAGALPPGRRPQLCVLALPPDMGFPELCAFLGGYAQRVRDVRLVRREGGGAAGGARLVLLTFADQAAADGFFSDFNGRPFCALEPELVCRAVFVRSVEICGGGGGSGAGSKAGSPGGGAAPASTRAPPGAAELPSCPVCLERLDESASGVVTTVCNHRFHSECLRGWCVGAAYALFDLDSNSISTDSL
jgi:BRCA1-associated protein